MSYLKILVTPGAKKERVESRPSQDEGGGEVLVLAVKEPASGNRANLRVREIVAARSGVPIGNVRILTGHHSRSKIVSIAS